MIRDAASADFAAILALNEESVHFLSPLDQAKLAALHPQLSYCRVVVIDKLPVAFLFALREGAAYDSVNYQWFAQRYAQFLYVDRVVVAASHQGGGLGRLLYEDLFEAGRQQGVSALVCEYDIDPPNETSRRFHSNYGFQEVGRQQVGVKSKWVSLQALSL